MDNVDYKLGGLEQGMLDVRNDIKDMKHKLDDLVVWRWKVVGAVSVIALISNVIATFIFKIIE